jgi:ERCC4-type nuclease
MEYGDAAFNGCGPDESTLLIGIERKTIQDLDDSMRTGRLSGHQLIGLLNSYWKVYLIVEGVWRTDKEGRMQRPLGRGVWAEVSRPGMTYVSLYMFLNSLSVMAGVITIFTQGISHTAGVIKALYHWWQRPYSDHRAHLNFHRPEPTNTVGTPFTPPNLVQRIAKELRGVGWERSVNLANAFQLPLDLVCASRDELSEVPGIGKGVADSIIKEMRGEDPPPPKRRRKEAQRDQD